MANAIDKLIDEYQRAYGNIPDEPSEQFEYFCEMYKITEKDKIKFLEDAERLLTEKWEGFNITLPIAPMASRRPRTSGDGHIYVPDINKHRKLVQRFIDYKGIVYTLCTIDIDIYVEIPSTMTKKEAYLAQMGLLRPLGPDWDNYAKTYCDCIQNTLIINDNIIVDGTCRKFYSIKPRVEITISYQPSFDSKYNKRRIINSKSYIRNKERIECNEYTKEE